MDDDEEGSCGGTKDEDGKRAQNKDCRQVSNSGGFEDGGEGDCDEVCLSIRHRGRHDTRDKLWPMWDQRVVNCVGISE